jgi:hypothetical protein
VDPIPENNCECLRKTENKVLKVRYRALKAISKRFAVVVVVVVVAVV